MANESRHTKAFKERHAKSNEIILASVKGYIGKTMGSDEQKRRNGVLIVTKTRVIFYRKGFIGEVIETMPIKSIASIERKSTLGLRVIRFYTNNDELEFKTFQKEGEAALIAAIESTKNVAPKAPSEAKEDPMEKLQKLATLKDSGIITQEEFNAKKAQLLSEL